MLSSVGQIAVNFEKVPISMAPKYWTYGKLSFPWNIQFTDFFVSTIQNEKFYRFIHPNTTNIIININDKGPLSVDLHIDMKPVDVDFMANQVNMIL